MTALIQAPPGDNRTQQGTTDAVIFPVSCRDISASVRAEV